MRKNPELTEEQKVEIVNLWNQGYGAPTIALKMKLYNSPVYRYISSLGLKRSKDELNFLRSKNAIVCKPSKHEDLSPNQEVKARELWERGYGATMIAREFRIHYTVVERFLKKNNLHRSPAEAYSIRKQILNASC